MAIVLLIGCKIHNHGCVLRQIEGSPEPVKSRREARGAMDLVHESGRSKAGVYGPWSMFPPHPLHLPSYTNDSCLSMKWIRWSISWLLRSTGQCGLWTWGLACISSIKFMENFPYSNFCLGSVYSIMCEVFLAGHKEVFCHLQVGW